MFGERRSSRKKAVIALTDDKLKSLNLPYILRFSDGSAVHTAADFQKRRGEIKSLLQKEIYGILPEKLDVEFELVSRDEHAFADKAVQSLYRLSFPDLNGFSFPVRTVFPKLKEPPPLFVFMNFRYDLPDKYYPAEEIMDGGFAVASFCYKDVTSDDGNFSNGLAGALGINRAKDDAAGKIALWAWAASETLDFLEAVGGYDKKNVAVAGHSRLGKTALVAGAFDERFKFTFSNNSGCAGAALTRQKIGENVDAICGKFNYWFCPAYEKYRNNENKMPFDQHFLLALCAPRYVAVSSAAEDLWADPRSEFLCCAAASPAYSLLGGKGLEHFDKIPKIGDTFFEGGIGYVLRGGSHYLSRSDWRAFMDFMRLKSAVD